jgi:putative sigma-54 modulation protein
MSSHLNFKHLAATDALKTHIEDKVEKLYKIVSYPMEIHVFLSVQKEVHSVEIKCHAEHKEMAALAKSKDLYESIDTVIHKLETQLKKERDKRKGHNRPNASIRKQTV